MEVYGVVVCFCGGARALGLLAWSFVLFNLWVRLGYLAKCGVVSGRLFAMYMYFVYGYVYDYDDWLSYLGCGLLT